MKKTSLFLLVLITIFLCGCASIDSIDPNSNFNGIMSENLWGKRSIDMNCDQVVVSGIVNHKIGSYEIDILIDNSKLIGSISGILLDKFDFTFNDKVISGKVVSGIGKKEINLNQGNFIITGEIKYGLENTSFDIQSNDSEIIGEKTDKVKGEDLKLFINKNKNIEGEILYSSSGEIFNLNSSKLNEEDIMIFVLLRIIDYMDTDIKRSSRAIS